jgi:hypothetical protein
MEIDELTSQIRETARLELKHPFPYRDCREISKFVENFGEFIPDLDLYSYTIWSYANGVKKILQRSEEQLRESKKVLQKSFFELKPEYISVKGYIKADSTPDLFSRIQTNEKLRILLLNLISLLLYK